MRLFTVHLFIGIFAALANLAADDTFSIPAGEQTHFSSTFNTAAGWELRDMVVTNGELTGVAGRFWMAAWHTFPRPLDFDLGDISIYWSLRADERLGAERGKVYLHLNMTDTPGLIEQFNLTMNVRPGGPGGFFPIYVDPGFNIPHTIEQILEPPAGGFTNPTRHENYRLLIRKTGTNTIELRPFWWNRSTKGWQFIEAQTGSQSPLVARIDQHLEGHQVIRSVELQFFEAVPTVDAIEVRQRPAFTDLRLTRNAGDLLITAQRAANRVLQLERSRDLMHWARLPDGTNPGSNVVRWSDPATAGSNAFYRVRSHAGN